MDQWIPWGKQLLKRNFQELSLIWLSFSEKILHVGCNLMKSQMLDVSELRRSKLGKKSKTNYLKPKSEADFSIKIENKFQNWARLAIIWSLWSVLMMWANLELSQDSVFFLFCLLTCWVIELSIYWHSRFWRSGYQFNQVSTSKPHTNSVMPNSFCFEDLEANL